MAPHDIGGELASLFNGLFAIGDEYLKDVLVILVQLCIDRVLEVDNRSV